MLSQSELMQGWIYGGQQQPRHLQLNSVISLPIFLCFHQFASCQTEGLQRELRALSRERQVLVLQMEALCAEAQQAERDVQDQYHRHQTELHCLREESLQVRLREITHF